MKTIEKLLEKAVKEKVFPGAVLLVSLNWEILIHIAVGYKALVPEKEPMKKDDIFDLASLTKPLVTTFCVMDLVKTGILDIDTPLISLFEDVPQDKRHITIRHLLSHSSGLKPWHPFFKGQDPPIPKERVYKEILALPLEAEPGKVTIYSDLGFMLLEGIVRKATSMEMAEYFFSITRPNIYLRESFFGGLSPPAVRGPVVPTEYCPWRRTLLRGITHDENAYAMGGYSGHAGLFSSAKEVYSLIRLIYSLVKAHEKIRTFWQRAQLVPNSTWCLGWDTPSTDSSSAGVYFSRDAVGHLGFTGTSVWFDPLRELLVIFLTNRVHPSRQNEKIKAFRPLLHDTVFKELFP